LAGQVQARFAPVFIAARPTGVPGSPAGRGRSPDGPRDTDGRGDVPVVL